MKEDKRCVICGFDKRVMNHHIIKRRIGGTNTDENLVYLCPNHHWIADFGTEEDRLKILKLIKEVTGKCGKEIEGDEKDILEKKTRVLVERSLCFVVRKERKVFSEEEWEDMKNTSNYSTTKSWLLGRGCDSHQSFLLNKKAEILLLIKKLKDELNKLTLF